MTGETSDTKQLALSGDRGAWDELVTRYDRAAMVALLARGYRAQEARDFLQAAWARIWERRERLSSLELPGLVVRQALFFAADARRSPRLPVLNDSSSPEDHEAEHPPVDLDEYVFSRQRLSRVEKLLREQPATVQQVFLLVHGGDGLSHAEVAARVGLSVQRVRQIMCELRQRLRAALEEP